MTPFILKLDEFGDILEFAKGYVTKHIEWKWTISDADLVELNDADIKISSRNETPKKEADPPSSIWRKMIGYKTLIFR